MRFGTLGLTCTIAAAAILASAGVQAQGRHPRYLRARTDLRTAQFYLRVREEPNVMRNLHAADGEVDAAVAEVDRAAVLDRKDMNDHPRIDSGLARKDRFRRIVDLLRSARSEHRSGRRQSPRAGVARTCLQSISTRR